jgi:hypothetical protein
MFLEFPSLEPIKMQPSTWRTFKLLTVFFHGKYVYGATINNCCEIAKSTNSFLHNPGIVNCGQIYNESLPPATPLYIPYRLCISECGEWSPTKPSQWVAPILQFLLPAVVFCIHIPRPLVSLFIPAIDDAERDTACNRLRSFKIWIGFPVLVLGISIIENLIWVVISISMAGPMILAGLYDALLDYRIIQELRPQSLRRQSGLLQGSGPAQRPARDIRVEVGLAVSLVCGSINLNSVSPRQIADAVIADKRLRRLIAGQPSFGAIVGIPVVFYLAAFVSTIVDLMKNSSDQDAAYSLAFGVEWMIIVHIAIVSGCLITSNNPSPTVMHVDLHRREADSPPAKWSLNVDNRLSQPVYMWERGMNKIVWLDRMSAWVCNGHRDSRDPTLGKVVKIPVWESIVFVGLPFTVLTFFPSALGAILAWQTPPVGFGCRSLSFVLYGVSQFVLTGLCYLALQRPPTKLDESPILWRSFGCVVGWWCLFLLFCGCSLFFGIVVPAMHILGLFHQCFCAVTANMWLDLDNAPVYIPSDTKDARDSSRQWIVMGSLSAALMGLCLYFSWVFRRYIGRMYTHAVSQIDDFWPDGSDIRRRSQA